MYSQKLFADDTRAYQEAASLLSKETYNQLEYIQSDQDRHQEYKAVNHYKENIIKLEKITWKVDGLPDIEQTLIFRRLYAHKLKSKA